MSQKLGIEAAGLSYVRPEVTTLAQLTRGGAWQLETLHVLPYHMLVWITRGHGRIVLHGLRRGFSAQNALFLPAGSVMSLEIGRQGLGQALVIPVTTQAELPNETLFLRIQEMADQTELLSILDTVRNELHAGRPLMDEQIALEVAKCSVWLRRQKDAQRVHELPNRAERLVRQFCDIVATQYHSGRPMAEYAEALDITPTHLTRVCKQVTGKTAADILTECVLHAAQVELSRSGDPINQIAKDLGFASAAYFTRFIQHHTGFSPRAFRQEYARR